MNGTQWKALWWAALFTCQSAWAAAPLRFAALTSWTMPYGKVDGDQLVDGILFDLGQALSTQMNMQANFVVLPRKRIDAAVLSGDIDVRCYVNPNWTGISEKFVWSGSLFSVTEVLFGNMAVPQASTLDSFPINTAVNTVLGFVYPALEPYFKSGALKREDAIDQVKVLLKTSARHTDYGASDKLALQWYVRNTPNHGIAPWRITISQNGFQCAIPKNGKVPAAKILAALDALKTQGRLNVILGKYQ